jgi:methylglutaconyl-CoA hydratase
MSAVMLSIDDCGVAHLVLNRPNVHNAFDDVLISLVHDFLDRAERDARTRVLILSGEGRSFSSGADLGWMRRMAAASREDNQNDARKLDALMNRLKAFRFPTIAKIHGAVMGGGVGLVAACDMAISTNTATFALSEVRLGLAPAVIAPYVIAKIGESQARRYFLSAEKFTAQQALQMGLVHEIVEDGDLDARVAQMVSTLLQNGPLAMERVKELIRHLSPVAYTEDIADYTTGLIAGLRASEEGKEGVNAFLSKTEPGWRTAVTGTPGQME